jgi:tetratricopeptide (TPR) repeat protein
MDAEHRHELKSNELAEWIAHIPTYIKEHPNQAIGVALILIALITWPLFSNMRKKSAGHKQSAILSMIDMAQQAEMTALQSQQTSTTESLTALAQSLKDEAAKAENPNLTALALIKQGNALRADLHLSDDVTDETISARISEARTAYEKAMSQAKLPALKGLAQLGLGLCAEETGEYEKAREIYQTVAADASYEGTAAPVEAQRRLESLEDNSMTVHFAPAPVEPKQVPPTPSDAQPTTAPQVPQAETTAPEQAPQAPASAPEPVNP